MKGRGFAKAERLQANRRRAPSMQWRTTAEHFALHEAYERAAEDQQQAIAALPLEIPEPLEHGRQFRARGAQPLKLVEHEHELASRRGGAEYELECRLPGLRRSLGQVRCGQPLRRGAD